MTLIVEQAVGDAPGAPVLVVEDNHLNQIVAEGMLRLLGYSCRCVSDGLEALEVLQKDEHSIVLMDVHMPLLDGYEATRRIRAELPAERQPYIIALSASVLPEDARLCRDAGMDDFVPKPVSKVSLRAALDRAGQPGGS